MNFAVTVQKIRETDGGTVSSGLPAFNLLNVASHDEAYAKVCDIIGADKNTGLSRDVPRVRFHICAVEV